MEKDRNQNLIQLLDADITHLEVDAIVNAANSSLLGGGGVDGAIHRGAGPELLAACRALGGCRTGDAKITRGFKLPARYIIHTVGPVWHGGNRGEEELLASCYKRCFELASQNELKTLAFPAISTGAYGFPPLQAARIAVRQALRAMQNSNQLDLVYFVCFGPDTRNAYRKALKAEER